ncbi:MAG: uracil-DNA glycosylase [Nitrospiraceae bacterium]|nr:uracil-DNA glycosylase [Nitrospiraceae bacterium]
MHTTEQLQEPVSISASELRTVMQYCQAMGIEHLPFKIDLKDITSTRSTGALTGPASAGNALKQAALDDLHSRIGECTLCRLSSGRTNLVFGEGNPDARIMFIGEAPGREEDRQGRPFVGEAGQVLTSLINKLGLSRQDVYIANICKCRPPSNRDPMQDEMDSCMKFVEEQIEIIDPEVIIALGRISSHTLSGSRDPIAKFSISKIRGKFFDYIARNRVIPVMPTFHPAYLMRNPKDKWLTWSDAQAVLRKIGMLKD